MTIDIVRIATGRYQILDSDYRTADPSAPPLYEGSDLYGALEAAAESGPVLIRDVYDADDYILIPSHTRK